MLPARIDFILMVVFLVLFQCPSARASHSQALREVSWEDAYWQNYSKRNMLPDIEVTVPQSEKDTQENQKLLLTKINIHNIGALEILEIDLSRASQTRPNLNQEKSVRLFAGTDDSEFSAVRGWLIQTQEAEKTKTAGFIAYGFYRHNYYGVEFPGQPEAFRMLSHKHCYEIEWYINPDYQRQGFASAALDAILAYCNANNNTTHMDYLLAVISPSNISSAQFAQRKGFQLIGRDINTRHNIWSLPIAKQEISSNNQGVSFA